MTRSQMSKYLSPFYTLQYPTTTPAHPDSFPDSRYYNVGKLDICIMISMIALMAILRDAFRLGFFEPLARWKLYRDLRRKREKAESTLTTNAHTKNVNGIANGNGHTNGNGHANGHVNGYANGHASSLTSRSPTRKEIRLIERSVMRFAEQGWNVVYYPLQWAFGMYVHVNLPTKIFEPSDLWRGYPHLSLAAPVKLYYLSQTAFYTHQILILNAEARRKDHWQMMSHHIITVILMISSYFTNFTRVGSIIMVLMDWCDIFLPLAKMTRYLGVNQRITDTIFAWFMVSWFVTRHVLFLFVIRSVIFDACHFIDISWDPKDGLFVTIMFHLFALLLLALQAIQLVWFWMICRVAWRVARGSGATDERSDEEGDVSISKDE